MFAIIQDQQQSAVPDVLDERRRDRLAGLVLDAKYGGDGLRHQAGVANGRQFDQPHAIRIVVKRVACATSRSRPMNDMSCCGRLFGVASSERSAGKSWRSSGCITW